MTWSLSARSQLLPEEESRTIDDVVPEDIDVVIPVAAGVFVVESQRVQHLVLDDAMLDAAVPLQRHHLLFANAAHGRETADEGNRDGRRWSTNGRRQAGTSLALLPLSRLEAQVHPFLLFGLEADASFGVELIQGRHNGVFLALICNSGSGWSVTKQVKERPLPL